MPTAEFVVDDVIGESFWFDGITAKAVNVWLKANSNASELLVRINSPGGYAHEGVAIYTALKRASQNAKVIVEVDGAAWSAASVIALAGDEIRMHKGSMLMWHEAWNCVCGNASDMESGGAALRKMNTEVADLYAARTGLGRDEVLEMMAKTTWLGADEAKELGACDTVIAAKTKGKEPPKQSAAAMALMAAFTGAPQAFVHSAVAAQGQQPRASASPSGQPTKETQTMSEDAKTVARLALLDRIESAVGKNGEAAYDAITAAAKQQQRVEQATGKTGDEAHGVIVAAMASHAELPKAQARVAELEKEVEGNALDGAIAKAKEEKKLTPAMEQQLREQFSAGEMSLKSVQACLSAMTPIAALQDKSPTSTTTETPAGAVLTFEGKSYAELKPMQKAKLKRDNPELFNAMHEAAQAS